MVSAVSHRAMHSWHTAASDWSTDDALSHAQSSSSSSESKLLKTKALKNKSPQKSWAWHHPPLVSKCPSGRQSWLYGCTGKQYGSGFWKTAHILWRTRHLSHQSCREKRHFWEPSSDLASPPAAIALQGSSCSTTREDCKYQDRNIYSCHLPERVSST